MEAVQGLRKDELAGQAGGDFEDGDGVEYRLLVVIGRVKLVGPVLGNHHMAGGTGTGAAAQAPGIETVLANDLHDPPPLDSVQRMRSAVQIGHVDDTHSSLARAVVLPIELAFQPKNGLTA